MKNIFLFLVMALFMTNSFVALAEDVPSEQEITNKIIRAVSGYANSISCPSVKINPNQIITLVPYKEVGDHNIAKYAVLWVGDVGCWCGSGTTKTNITIVTFNCDYIVDPLRSSPIIKFNSPVRYVERTVGNTSDSMTLEGMKYGPDDARCCPSIPVRFTLKEDNTGNWKLVSEEKSQ